MPRKAVSVARPTKVKAAASPALKAAPARQVKTRRRPTVAENGPLAVDVHVGSRVRLARLLAGRSQSWLGEQVGLTFQQIQKYERGANRVSCSMLSEFAEALERPIAWFFADGEDGIPEQPLSIETIDRQRLTYELVSGFNRLPHERLREHLVGLVRTIAEAEVHGK